MAEFAHVVSAPASDAPTYSAVRKYTLLLIFCFSQFLDAFKYVCPPVLFLFVI